MDTLYDIAAQRVRNTPELERHKAFILADWPEGDAHWKWVAVATVEEIVSWASVPDADQEEEPMSEQTCTGWKVGGDWAVAVGRFNPDGPDGYRAATMPDAPLRKTRAEAVTDEVQYRTGRRS